MKKNEIKIIPSPYSVVRSYEKAFQEVFRDNLAAALHDTLKYIARVAATTIKEGISIGDIITQPLVLLTKKDAEKAEETDIEKAAHQVGDIHPNGKWMWIEYAPGKFDWRTIKGGKHSAKISAISGSNASNQKTKYRWGEILPEIDKMDRKQIQDHLISKGILRAYAPNNDLYKADITSVKQIASSLIKLHEKIPFQPIIIELAKLKGATMDACVGFRVRMNEKLFTDFKPDKYYKGINEDYRKKYEDSIKFFQDNIKAFQDAIDTYPKTNLTASQQQSIDDLKEQIDYAEKKIAKYEARLKSNPCWTVGEKETLASDIFLHEMGHILNGQCTGSCTVWKQPKYVSTYTATERALHLQLNEERDKIFERYKKESEHISEYSQTKNVEFFAECFVYWIKEDKRLPKYIRDYYDKYFKLTTPKFKF